MKFSKWGRGSYFQFSQVGLGSWDSRPDGPLLAAVVADELVAGDPVPDEGLVQAGLVVVGDGHAASIDAALSGEAQSSRVTSHVPNS